MMGVDGKQPEMEMNRKEFGKGENGDQ